MAVPFTFEVADNVWAILFPLPVLAPLTPEAFTVQLNVVPETLFGLVIEKPVDCPEQSAAVEGVTLTVGFWYTVNKSVFSIVWFWVPVHPVALILTVAFP